MEWIMKLEKICYNCPEIVQKTCEKSLTQNKGALCDLLEEGDVIVEQRGETVTATDGRNKVTVFP